MSSIKSVDCILASGISSLTEAVQAAKDNNADLPKELRDQCDNQLAEKIEKGIETLVNDIWKSF
jgi:hypothetical protein